MRWRPIASAPKTPIGSAGYGPVILLRVGNFVISDQWKPGLPEYPLQSHWRNWPYVQPRTQPTHWAEIDPIADEPTATIPHEGLVNERDRKIGAGR